MEVSVGAKPPRPAAYSTAPAAPPMGKEVTVVSGRGHKVTRTRDVRVS